MDDAHVSQANASNVLNQKAYVLFYIKQSPESNTLPVSRPLSQVCFGLFTLKLGDLLSFVAIFAVRSNTT